MKNSIQTAKEMAIAWHGDQKYGDQLYSYHLNQVEQILVEAGLDSEEYGIQAWLHDVLEDTPIEHQLIETEFGSDMLTVLLAVSGFGANRRARNQDIKTKLMDPNTDRSLRERAQNTKAADRIANVTESIKTNNLGLMKMYTKEFGNFKSTIPLVDFNLLERLNQVHSQAFDLIKESLL